jgi:hypothetical protein
MTPNALSLHRVASHELLREVLVDGDCMKQFDESTSPARSTVYQWTRPLRPKGTGSRNPLDNAEAVIRAAKPEGKARIAHWICLAAKGFFIPGPDPEHRDTSELFKHSSQLIQEFAQMIETLAETARDGKIEPHEAKEIRRAWQKIQSTTEFYVRQCESGEFDPERKNKEKEKSKPASN